tara:strand:+ start:251 stop:526 length:276 start_codon:yes stop_codon:yes gene_type:complete
MMPRIQNTRYWLLKNSRGQYICEGNRLKQNSSKAIMFDTKRDAVQYKKSIGRRSFFVQEVIGITLIDNSNHPRTVVTYEEKMIDHRQSDED